MAAAVRLLRPQHRVVHETGIEVLEAGVDILLLPTTIATNSAGSRLRIGMITRLLQDTTMTIVDLLLCVIGAGVADFLLPIIAKEVEFLPVGGNATEA